MLKIKPIAIHLPQFHPIPENDEWWGKGFTEWTNVTKAKPLFKDHYQPHLPADLGFYDLRLEEARMAQIELAKQNGIYGFCYYHYWFNGKRMLNLPVDKMLENKSEDFPFMLCWANENWTRRWDGKESEVLLEQKYSDKDDLDHIRFLFRYFEDPRYIKVCGKPTFIVYKSDLLPDSKKTTDLWRSEAIKMGIGELYLVRMEFDYANAQNPNDSGFDASVEFQPFFKKIPRLNEETFVERIARKIFTKRKNFYWENRVHSYNDLVNQNLLDPKLDFKIFPGVTPSWDNASRRKSGATIYKDSSPALYEKWLRNTVDRFVPFGIEENFIFINAWNEWAEGNHLEPCAKWGNEYLDATRRVFEPNKF